MQSRTYPAHLEGQLDEPLSRWKWLVKWFLAIPHFVVLAFLWLAFLLMTIYAGFAVLFTRRYPRTAFDFNVGVLRWTWRVAFYAFVLGSDRYPPFSLDSHHGYPADFDVEYPEQLSRPLVLVKWWLLAIPHYLVISLFGGGMTWWTWNAGGDDASLVIGGGLIGLLALVAGVLLTINGRYPRTIFDLIVGLERWTFRVVAYAALMSDQYPPFRLDVGGAESPAAATPVSPRPSGDLTTA